MISSNLSSIMANQSYMNASAANVANVSSDGFAPVQTTLNEGVSGGVRATFSQQSIDASMQSQTTLATEMTDQISIDASVTSNVAALKAQDEIFGSLLDVTA
ncbi:MAG: hypothetical protein DSZ03_06605 [Sulfurimonas sp.]|nr:MAG: hypothetical protein DSZ03_06605 [Sulfurimonas sp.]